MERMKEELQTELQRERELIETELKDGGDGV
jgi:hypothetical protein